MPNAVRLIQVAHKVRHAELFRKCFAYLAGKWSKPSAFESTNSDTELDSKVVVAIKAARANISAIVVEVHEYIVGDIAYINIESMSAANLKLSCVYNAAKPTLPHYYRQLFEANISSFSSRISPLLKSNLFFDRSNALAGKEKREDYFLCAEIADKDLA